MSGYRQRLLLTLALCPAILANAQAPEASSDETDALPTITIFASNRLPGQPQHVWQNALTWYGSGGRFGTLEAQHTGDYYGENANEVKIDDHWLFNLKAGDSWRLGSSDTRLGTNIGVSNLLDEDYYENVRINSFGGRYYEPAAGRTYFAGLELSF